jgi:hypothetical protein
MYAGSAGSGGFSLQVLSIEQIQNSRAEARATKSLEISFSFGIAGMQSEVPAASIVRNPSLGSASFPKCSR